MLADGRVAPPPCNFESSQPRHPSQHAISIHGPALPRHSPHSASLNTSRLAAAQRRPKLELLHARLAKFELLAAQSLCRRLELELTPPLVSKLNLWRFQLRRKVPPYPLKTQTFHLAHGCTARPAYYEQHGHRQTCAHAPCHCPGKGCGFVGSTAALWDHFSGVHGWPCTTKVLKRNKMKRSFAATLRYVYIHLCDGFNFLLFDRHPADDQGDTTSTQYLFLLNVVRQPNGRAISVFWIHPNAGASCGYVACTDLSDGLPSPDGCVQFILLDSVVADRDRDAIKVGARVVF
ncbi:hypothetical protein EJB05_33736, partial [Eragrostis curvula]